MTIKFHTPKIRLVNPFSAVRSAARSAKRKLQSSGSQPDLTKVRSEDPNRAAAPNGTGVAARPAEQQEGEFAEAGLCLYHLKNSRKKGDQVFLNLALQEADKLNVKAHQITVGG